jgi:hypothetical protein
VSAAKAACALLLLASLAAGAAPSKTIRVAKGFAVFGPLYSPALFEVPRDWRIQPLPKAKQPGEHILLTATRGAEATLAVAAYDDKHPRLPTAERYLKTQTQGAEVQRVLVGRNKRLARSYERSTARRRDVFVVFPRLGTPLYCVIRYSASPEAFERHRPIFQHLLDTWVFKYPDTGPRGGR